MSRSTFISWLLVFGIASISACQAVDPGPSENPAPVVESALVPAETANPTSAPITPQAASGEALDETIFTLTSAAFVNAGPIPARYSCDGENISPPLEWSHPPAGTQSFALINDDPDAPGGTWVHWLVYNIPAGTNSLAEGIPALADLGDGSSHGENSWGRADYGGPCPPSGTHRYFFKLYALDAALDFTAAPTKDELLEAMQGHVLAEAELMGTYER